MFADIKNTRNVSHPHIQDTSLLSIMAVYLLAKHFQMNPSIGNALLCIFLLNMSLDFYLNFIPMPDCVPLSWTDSKLGDIIFVLYQQAGR